jgi:hypothetical protein
MPLDTRLPLLAGQFKPITYQAPSQANMLAEVAQAASAMQGLQRNAMAMREAEQERTASAGVAEIIRKAQGQQLSPDMLDQMADALAGMPKFLGKSAEMKQAAAQMRSMRAALGQTTVEPLAGMGGAAGASADAAQQRYGQVNLLPLLSLGAEGQQAANLLLKQNELRLGARPPAEPEDVRKARAFGFGLTPEGYGAMQAAGRAQPAPPADPEIVRSMRALGFPENPEGFAAYQAAMRTTQAAPQDTELVRNLKALGLPLNEEGVARLEASRRAPAAVPNASPIPESVNLGNRVVIFDKNPNSPTFNQELRSMEVGAKPETVRPPNTAPEPKQVQLGDRVATIDNNPNSPTFGKELGSLQMGAGPMTTAQIEANKLAEARLDLDTRRVELENARFKAQQTQNEQDARIARRNLQLAERRFDLATRQFELESDPAFQARMASARTVATETAKSDVAALAEAPTAIEQGNRAMALLNRMVGDPKARGTAAQPHPGFQGVVGATLLPGARLVQGTPEADFDAMLEQVLGGAFLEAYERLKGTGQITEIEGKKATQAITRMQRSVSESEFMQAATEFRSALQTALDRTNTRLSTARTRTQPPAPTGAGAQPPAAPAAPAGGFPAPTQAAIDALKRGQGTDAQFDAIFGPGAAAKARGR